MDISAHIFIQEMGWSILRGSRRNRESPLRWLLGTIEKIKQKALRNRKSCFLTLFLGLLFWINNIKKRRVLFARKQID